MTPPRYKELREKVGTQHEVAALLGVSRPTIARRETPAGRINEEAAIAIAELARRSDFEENGKDQERK